MFKGLISIITINRNNKSGLIKTVESVVNQDFVNVEHIIIDGGSTDGSKEFIYENKSLFSFWVSESDNGIYHAMNKGIANSKGEYLYFLNSGDVLYEKNVFTQISKNLHKDFLLISFNVEVADLINAQRKIWRTKSQYRFSEVAFGHLPHQGFLFHRKIFTTYGFYNENNKIVSDWQLLLKLVYNNINITYCDIIVAIHFLDGISNDLDGLKIQEYEREKVLSEYSSLYLDLIDINLISSGRKLIWTKIKNLLVKKRRFNQ
jgi:glycosyltransferase involved in cell wall biosynthesis